MVRCHCYHLITFVETSIGFRHCSWAHSPLNMSTVSGTCFFTKVYIHHPPPEHSIEKFLRNSVPSPRWFCCNDLLPSPDPWRDLARGYTNLLTTSFTWLASFDTRRLPLPRKFCQDERWRHTQKPHQNGGTGEKADAGSTAPSSSYRH